MASGDSSSSGQNNNVVHYDYGTSDDKKSDSSKAPRFNGNPEEFSWFKTNMYSHIMGLKVRKTTRRGGWIVFLETSSFTF